MPAPERSDGLLKRNPLALWFLGLALLGGARFHLAFSHDSPQSPEPTTWTWLIGSIVLGAIGLALLLGDLHRRRRARDTGVTRPTED